MKKALVVVDVQNDFCEGGNLAVTGGKDVARRISDDWQQLRDQYDYIVATKDFHPHDLPGHFEKDGGEDAIWPVHCVAGEEGSELAWPLVEHMFDAVFEKGQNAAAYSGFEGVEQRNGVHTLVVPATLDFWLRKRNVSDVDVCGLATDYCVKATALSGWEKGYNTGIRTKYTAAVADQDGTLADLRKLGIFTD